jgi:hypothetical protein
MLPIDVFIANIAEFSTALCRLTPTPGKENAVPNSNLCNYFDTFVYFH